MPAKACASAVKQALPEPPELPDQAGRFSYLGIPVPAVHPRTGRADMYMAEAARVYGPQPAL